jgi:hypothetical protein
MILVIEQSCDDVLTELYRGKFLFLQYDSSSGDECFVKIPIENTGDVIDLTTKWDQKVDLTTTVAFDGATALDSYSKLGLDLMLPSKGILLQDKSSQKVQNVETANGDELFIGDNFKWFTFEFELDNEISEIGNYGFDEDIVSGVKKAVKITVIDGSSSPVLLPNAPSGQPTQQLWDVITNTYITNTYSDTRMGGTKYYYPDSITKLVNFQEFTNSYELDINPCTLSYQLDFLIEAKDYYLLSRMNLYLAKKDINGTITIINVQHINDNLIYQYCISTDLSRSSYSKVKSSLSYSNTNFILNKGDEVYLFVSCLIDGINRQLNLVRDKFKITVEPTSFFSLKAISKTKTSTTKAFLVNEVISRISEAITNNKIKAYSEYFGRTDSQPYAVSSNGIGSMEALAKGIYIRNQQNRIVGQPNVFSLSMKDVFEGIEPIHHIGFGIEDDPNREGFKRLRVEHWKHFYTDDIIMNCIGVRNIQRKIVESKHYSTFQFGYEKYESEQYNGLDEFLTKRTFRTTLNGLKNELNKLSKFIASGYAWEITRRKNTDSSDWRFDNDTFIVCLKDSYLIKKGTTNVEFFIEDGFIRRIKLTDASLVGLAALSVGDRIIVTNATLNIGEFTISSIVYDGTSLVSGTYIIYVRVTEAIVAETITSGNYTIKRTGGYFVETGNIDSPTNLVDPDTTYNYRISPIRNAMRWMDKIAEGYKSSPSIIFTDGAGNYFASGKMTDSFGRLEDNVISENETIVTATFADTTKIAPLLAPEQLTFDFPMSIAEFKTIMENPYGKIHWSNEFESGYAYLSSIKYKPEEGIANFLLIPKILT